MTRKLIQSIATYPLLILQAICGRKTLKCLEYYSITYEHLRQVSRGRRNSKVQQPYKWHYKGIHLSPISGEGIKLTHDILNIFVF